jgi:uncharacterized protein DUF1707
MDDRRRMRASDQDRQQVVDQLRGAVADGRLRMDEFEQRMAQAYQAVTYGDLDPLCADLPAPAAAGPAVAAPSGVRPRRSGVLAGLPAALRVLWTIWLAAVLVNVVVWVLVSATSMHLAYPWPLWVAGPWGAVLLAKSVGCRRPAVRG